MKKTLCTIAVLSILQVNANEQLGAHVHGEAQLNVVIDGDHLHIALETPAMNVMGFEHEPATEADLETSHKALHELKDADWIHINGGKCELEDADVDWKYAKAVHDHFHKEHKGEEHKHEEHKHEEHKHEEHKHEEHKHDEHKHGEHKHGEKKDGEHDHDAHSDVDAKYTFHCDNVKSLKSIEADAFSTFSGFEKINVQWIKGDKQGSQTLIKTSHMIKFN